MTAACLVRRRALKILRAELERKFDYPVTREENNEIIVGAEIGMEIETLNTYMVPGELYFYILLVYRYRTELAEAGNGSDWKRIFWAIWTRGRLRANYLSCSSLQPSM